MYINKEGKILNNKNLMQRFSPLGLAKMGNVRPTCNVKKNPQCLISYKYIT